VLPAFRVLFPSTTLGERQQIVSPLTIRMCLQSGLDHRVDQRQLCPHACRLGQSHRTHQCEPLYWPFKQDAIAARAERFFRELLKGRGRAPRRLITDKLCSYSAAHGLVMPSVVHSTQQYENNRAEVSHQPTRQRERQMRRFKSAAHAQRFLSVHGLVRNLFRVGHHLLRAAHHRLLRTRSFLVWNDVTGSC